MLKVEVNPTINKKYPSVKSIFLTRPSPGTEKERKEKVVCYFFRNQVKSHFAKMDLRKIGDTHKKRYISVF